MRINEPWTGAIMDVVKDANDRGKVSIGFEFRQDLLQDVQWMETVTKHVTYALTSLSLGE